MATAILDLDLILMSRLIRYYKPIAIIVFIMAQSPILARERGKWVEGDFPFQDKPMHIYMTTCNYNFEQLLKMITIN